MLWSEHLARDRRRSEHTIRAYRATAERLTAFLQAHWGARIDRADLARVTAEGVADMVDESVAMAFGPARGSNYVRIQAGKAPAPLCAGTAAAAAGAMLAQRNVESVLFRGRRLSERTNAEKVDALATELVKEQERRRRSPLPNVAIKEVAAPRLSSATTASSGTATARTASTMPSPASWDSRR